MKICDFKNVCKFADSGECSGDLAGCKNETVKKQLSAVKKEEKQPDPEDKRAHRQPVLRKQGERGYFVTFTMVVSFIFFMSLGYGYLVSIITAVILNIYLRICWHLSDWFKLLFDLVNDKRGVS